ncbi:5-oxoprolinase subunit B family protein [Zavarzinella formosa]|uniref:5-oxoprolinase subunit B family protein n=1 Tax=Zavarzinella formosa TaxID=360055 RepID=UPI0002F10EAE|nr:allophanate hydrolase subunit 1 [Zavarzinella formosa]
MTPNFQPLGDRAILASLPDEAVTVAFAEAVRDAGFPWLVDLVPAYLTVGVFFDASMTLATVRTELGRLVVGSRTVRPTTLHRIPCCYDFDLDLPRVSEHTAMSFEEIICQHTGGPYTVYAIGFVPGFPYLGYLPEALTGVPRLPSPRLRVEPGSVGLTARQTGIYPLPRPGGWNLIGRTPLELVNLADGYFPIAVGDQVSFERIDRKEFQRLEGERL